MARTIALLALVLIASASASGPATAGMPMIQKVKCPIGGKSFNYTTTASYSTWGARPDGKPYGSWDFPMELPKCPDNGLVMFDEFTKEEVKRLGALVGSPEYRAMKDVETNYFLAAWLAEKLGRSPVDVAWILLQASWEADGRPELKARYQNMYVERIRALPKSGDLTTWLAMQGRGVNALRELKRFGEAETLLASLDLSSLDVPVPERKEGGATPSGLGKQIFNYDETREAERKRGFLAYFRDMGELIRARDASAEPLRMIPPSAAAHICEAQAAGLSQADAEFCASPELKKLRGLD
jgi:hypothetical protein